MNPQARFVKTDKGHDEIKNRTHKLEARTRQLLVMVDGGKAAGDLLQTSKGFGGSPELLLSLLKAGFIREAAESETVAPVAAPVAAPAAAAGPMSDEAREKLYAAKGAMRRYIKMAAVEIKALSKVVDDVKVPADLAPALLEMKAVFEANGFDEAFANLSKEISGSSGR
jgi:hypothetical protein